MFLRRLIEHLKTQNWTAIGIELVIVILGVFIGTQVSNWNQARIEKRETAQLLLELQPALQSFADFFDTAKDYYATTRRYSETAFAGWRGDPGVSDGQFVISAYQASQIYTFGVKGENWASIFGGERMRDIDNAEVRRGLTNLMTLPYDQIDLAAVATPIANMSGRSFRKISRMRSEPNAPTSQSPDGRWSFGSRPPATSISRKAGSHRRQRPCGASPSWSANYAGTALRSRRSSPTSRPWTIRPSSFSRRSTRLPNPARDQRRAHTRSECPLSTHCRY